MLPNCKDLSDNHLRRACRQVTYILGTFQRPELVVARAASKLDTTYAVHLQNRNKITNPQKLTKRPHFNREQRFFLLVMNALEEEEKRQEIAGHALTHSDWIKRLCKHLVMFTSTHSSYHAAVAVGRILGTYTAPEVRRLYEIVAPNRAETKLDAECCRIKNAFKKSIEARFVGMPKEMLFKKAPYDTLPPSDWRVSLTSEALKYFAPIGSIISDGYLWKPGDGQLLPFDHEDPHGDSAIELDRMSLTFNKEQFNEFAKAAKLKLFDECLKTLNNWWPFPPDAEMRAKANLDEDSDSDADNQYDLKEIRDYVEHERERRRNLSFGLQGLPCLPGLLKIRVDGIDCAAIREPMMEYETIFDDAMIVEIVGQDDEGDVVLATYVMTYDQPRTEIVKIDLPLSQSLLSNIEYDEENRARAKFTFVEDFN